MVKESDYIINKVYVERYIKLYNLTKREFCEKADISLYALKKILTETGKVRSGLLIKICNLLQMPAAYLIVEKK